ncbi:hypothetical protein SAMN05216516_103279 [Izhakiella capsodis]|uniref:Uncharacterized protein n=1 Tax=Izhakiella capsodis TaxID=1367852 RepID=A0A1I4X4F4_9GAMM|nr:hypothetical protein [Izhakiella capsodis]SFN20532.1 hypothetical protein SAMN05216516_103279 [Izhakiella capsodis]
MRQIFPFTHAYQTSFFPELNGLDIDAQNNAAKAVKCQQTARSAIYTDVKGSGSEIHDATSWRLSPTGRLETHSKIIESAESTRQIQAGQIIRYLFVAANTVNERIMQPHASKPEVQDIWPKAVASRSLK